MCKVHVVSRRGRAFTLVELLVVISIIGLLLSLLLPSMQGAREAGRTTVCTSNLRQAALAINAYQGEHHGWYPQMYGIDQFGNNLSWRSTLEPYMTGISTMACPSIKPQVAGSGTYEMQGYGGGFGWQNRSGTGGNDWERFNMKTTDLGVRMAGITDPVAGTYLFDSADTWSMDPVASSSAYFVETVGSNNWCGTTGEVFAMPHTNMRMNFITAGLGIAYTNFAEISLTTISYRLYSDGSAMWFRVYAQTDWPLVRTVSPSMVQ